MPAFLSRATAGGSYFGNGQWVVESRATHYGSISAAVLDCTLHNLGEYQIIHAVNHRIVLENPPVNPRVRFFNQPGGGHCDRPPLERFWK